MRQHDGFTLIELLISAAILLILLGALGSLYVGTQRAYQTNESVSNERQNLQAVTELLQYEMGLAGYRCTDNAASALGRVFAAPPVTVSDGASGGPDEVTIRYYEDRYNDGACSLKTVKYFVDSDTLWREAGGTAEAAVSGVTDLQVSAWLDRSNNAFLVATDSANDHRPTSDKDLAGMSLKLVIGDAAGRLVNQTVTIGFKNLQCANLADCL